MINFVTPEKLGEMNFDGDPQRRADEENVSLRSQEVTQTTDKIIPPLEQNPVKIEITDVLVTTENYSFQIGPIIQLNALFRTSEAFFTEYILYTIGRIAVPPVIRIVVKAADVLPDWTRPNDYNRPLIIIEPTGEIKLKGPMYYTRNNVVLCCCFPRAPTLFQ
jgi:hypothetical protein